MAICVALMFGRLSFLAWVRLRGLLIAIECSVSGHQARWICLNLSL